MSSPDAAWNDLDRSVLRVFEGSPLTAGDVREELPGVPDSHVRTALSQHVEWGYLTVQRGAVRTTYRLTARGRAHLASTMEVA